MGDNSESLILKWQFYLFHQLLVAHLCSRCDVFTGWGLMDKTVETGAKVTSCLPSSHGRIHGRSNTWVNFGRTTSSSGRQEKSRIWTREPACAKAPGLGKPWIFSEASVMSITSQKAVAAAETWRRSRQGPNYEEPACHSRLNFMMKMTWSDLCLKTVVLSVII